MTAKRALLERKIIGLLGHYRASADQIRSVLDSTMPEIPKSYVNNSVQYNRLLVAAKRQGMDYSTVKDACDSEGFSRLTRMRVANAFAAQEDLLARTFNQCIETGFHSGFGDSNAYHYISGNKVFEKMVTRTLTQEQYREAVLSMSNYLSKAA